MTFLRKTLALSALLAVAVALFGAMATTAHAADDEGVGIFRQEQVLFATSVNDPAHIPRIADAITVTDEATLNSSLAVKVPVVDGQSADASAIAETTELDREEDVATITILDDGPPLVPPNVVVATIGTQNVDTDVYGNTGIFSNSDVWFMTTALAVTIPLLVLLAITRTRLFVVAAITKIAEVGIPRQLSHGLLIVAALTAVVVFTQSVASARVGSVGLLNEQTLLSLVGLGLILLIPTLALLRFSRGPRFSGG